MDGPSQSDLLEQIVDSFLGRFRNGERPSIDEYVSRHPGLADQIRELLPALVMVEQDISLEGVTGELRRCTSGVTSPMPRHLGEYLILREIGRGGMGVVYEAVQQSLGRHVALKVLPPHGRIDATRIGRFRREARAAAGLHHTNIVPVFAVGEQDGTPYYAMQFIQGQGIDAILDALKRLRCDDAVAEIPSPRADQGSGQGNGLPSRGYPGFVDHGVDAMAVTESIARGLLSGRFLISADREQENSQVSPIAPVDITLPIEVETNPTIRATGLERAELISHSESLYFRTVARIGPQTADALAYAHGQGICHRDIKPSNLLLDRSGTVWVADFGLAKSETVEEGLTRTGDIVGTLRYMAPERFNGWADARSDVYALGVTLYEMLTLRPAFEESDRLKLIERISIGSVPKPRSIDPKIPGDLETIVLKAMAREPGERYIAARAMADDLERFLADRTILARRSTTLERSWRWCRRNPALAWVTTIAATLVVLIAIGSTLAAFGFRQQLDRTRKAEHRTHLALGNSLISEAAALQRTGLIGQRFDSLDRLAGAAKVLGGDRESWDRLPEIRKHAITALGLTDLRALPQRDHGDIYSLSVDAALERYAVAERSGAVVVHRLDNHRELVRLPAPEQSGFWHAETLFSPDGELLVAVYVGSGGSGDLLRVWHLGRRELLGSLQRRTGGAFYGGAFSPDSRRFLFCPPEGGISVWDRAERRVVRRLPLDFAPHYLALDPEGRRLAINNQDAPARVVILELESGRVLTDWKSQVGNTNLAWSADGQLLAIGSSSDDCRVYVWNVHRGELASVLQGHTGYIFRAEFAHTGYLLATALSDGSTRLWDAASGELLATAPGSLLGFAPDDRQLAYGIAGAVGVWDVASGDECRTLHPAMLGNRGEMRDATNVLSGAFSADGRLMATSEDGGGVRLWESDTGRELAHLKAGFCDTVLFHPDRQNLISSGKWGLYRWPIQPNPDGGPDAIRIGPPELLWETANNDWNPATWLPSHRTLALVDNPNARVWLIDSRHPHPAWSRAAALDSGGNHRMRSIAVSPDGHWLAVGGWKAAGVRVWDLHLRRLERLLRPNDTVGDTSFVAGFSPDGQWLISSTGSGSGNRYHFWRTGTWDLGRRIDQERHGTAFYPPIFTGDGRLMALGIAPDQVLLADAATGRELVRLTTLQSITPTPLAFSPDGTKLAAATRQRTVLLWDLRRIRGQLVPLGLDWDAPVYPASTPTAAGTVAGPIHPPRPVRVVGEVLQPQARRKAERRETDRRLVTNPDDAEALIHRGWLSLKERRLPEAIADLDHLHRLKPGYPDVNWLLSQAYQDADNPAGALRFFSRVLERAPDDHEARFQRGLIAFALGRAQQAEGDFASVLAADPTNDNFRYHHARALNRLRRYRDALAEVDVLFPRHPDDFALFQLRGTAYDGLGEREPAWLAWEKAYSYLSMEPAELNKRARIMSTGPLTRRDPDRGVVLARQAVALAPNQSRYRNTLGAALYGVGRFSEAIDVLEQSRKAGLDETEGVALFFLAMAHHQLGHTADARTCFDRAVQWSDGNKKLSSQHLQNLAAFRAEAEAILADPGGDLPADVFAPR